MRRALNLLRPGPHRRRDAFDAGLRAAGFQCVDSLPRPTRHDLLLTWNRYGGSAELAEVFEAAGATVLVAENCPFGNDFRGGNYSLARRHVAIAGGELVSGDDFASRWDSWRVELKPWRQLGGETIILGQRGIGHPAVRSPDRWADSVRTRIGGRIRQHPGIGDAVPLADDLRRASAVVTWCSAAALQALVLGVPVWHALPTFAGAIASRPLSEWGGAPNRDDAARLQCFRRLAWALWSIEEIATGEPIGRLVAG